MSSPFRKIAPSPFGSKGDSKMSDRLTAMNERRAQQEAEARVKAKRHAEATDFASTKTYPPLGAATAPKPKTQLNYKATVSATSSAPSATATSASSAPTVKSRMLMRNPYSEKEPDEYDGESEEEEEEEAEVYVAMRPGAKGPSIW